MLQFQQLLLEFVFHGQKLLFRLYTLCAALVLNLHDLADGVDQALVGFHQRVQIQNAALGLAAALKTGTIETAREAERGILDLNTLVETNQSLIDTINEVMKIQDEGRAQRVEAEKQLVTMENELKQKLLELKH